MAEKEYIERDRVHNCLDDLSSENLIGNDNDTFISLPEAHDRIDNISVTDVVEVKHGNWERKFDEMGIDRGYKCSACGNYVYQMTYEPYVFCPHCGAKMDNVSNIESGAKVMLRLCGNQYKYCDGICKNCNESEYHATNSIQRDVTNG